MKMRVQRWGDSLAICIPKPIADEIGLAANDEVEIASRNGQLILTTVKSQSYSLDALLNGITPDNRPDDWDMGLPAGKERW